MNLRWKACRVQALRAIQIVVLILIACIGSSRGAQTLPPADMNQAINPALPTIFVVGDSTAAYHTDITAEGASGVQGWGVLFQAFINPAKFNVVNAAMGGRSSRTYLTEGLWSTLMHQIRPGDIVLIQLGHNDVFPINDDSRARGTLPGTGPEFQEIDNLVTHHHETVHTYGWYLAQYVEGARSSGAIPIVLSLTPRNVWEDGTIEIGVSGYRKWAAEVAKNEKVDFVDLTGIMVGELTRFGQAKTSGLYHSTEPVHTTLPGAYLAAECVVAGLKAIPALTLNDGLSSIGRLVSPAKTSFP
jgi:lysophospholipase L1-like esterase